MKRLALGVGLVALVLASPSWAGPVVKYGPNSGALGARPGETATANALLALGSGNLSDIIVTECFITTNTTRDGIDCNAHATDGQSMLLKEGADDGSDTFSIKVPNSGLSATQTCTLTASDGTIPGSCTTAGAQVKYTTADYADSTGGATYSTMGNELDFAVLANTKYIVDCNLITYSAATTTGMQLRVQGPTAPTYVSISRNYNNAGTITPITRTAFDGAATDDGAVGNSGTAATANIDTVHIYLNNAGNAGTIQFAFQTEVGASAANVLRGSSCIYRKLP